MNHRDWCIDFKIFVKIYKVHYIFGFKVAIWWVPIWFEKYSIQYFAWKIRNIKIIIIIIIIRRENIYHTFLTRVQNSGSNKLYGILSLSLSLFPPTLFNFAPPDCLHEWFLWKFNWIYCPCLLPILILTASLAMACSIWPLHPSMQTSSAFSISLKNQLFLLFNLFLLLFMGIIVLFDTIHGSYFIISAIFQIYLLYF